MTTRDVSIFEVRPATDGPTLPPAPARAPRPQAPFSAAIDHALKPAPGRAAKASGRARNEEAKPGLPARTKAAAKAIAQKKTTSPPVGLGGSAAGKAGKGERGDTSPPTLVTFSTAQRLDVESTDEPAHTTAEVGDEVGADVELDEDLFASIVPDNIIAFPTPSNIIPFPLQEARAGARMEGSSGAAEKGSAGEIALPSHARLGAADVISSPSSGDWTKAESIRPPAMSPDRAETLARGDSDANEGLDVTALGSQPLAEPELADNIRAVDFAKASIPQDAADTPSVASIIPVAFRIADAPEKKSSAPEARVTQLPGDALDSEESASPAAFTAPSASRAPSRPISTKQAGSADRRAAQTSAVHATEASGTSAARQDQRMESFKNAEQDGAFAGRPASALEGSSGVSARASQDELDAQDFSARSLSATEWQAGRPVSSSDRPSSHAGNGAPADATRSIERITGLVVREAALVKQHSSDSMSVVLRPDAETELLVHFTQRNGQIEASIRCERGDSQHLGALWAQLQESLAQQKVRLAPLQESSFSQPDFNSASGADRNGGGPGSDRQPPRQSLDEWPAPASPGASGAATTSTAHVRGGGGSRHRRISTSRPGWETWA